jgi:hypothetical protein
VVVRAEGPGAPEAGSRITVLGDGPTDGVLPEYRHALDALLQQLAGAQWLAWWSASGDRVLQISYDFAAITATIDTRRSRGTLLVSILRPAATFSDTDDVPGLARRDVDAMLATVRRHTRLGPHPRLTNPTP